ncbi:hypothetical protein [Moorena sp. SIO3I6]|uniref:hypothetical protein n=1 Tax=Moorena sp. SIO3I6 TaxID=2607831 RepID=UPI0013F7922F|nr:hypothetical protein [Moorena sp. SIO3I6]NEP23534.1 hypothetical protein [Moorena sp. SIO3I6]
MSSWPEPTLTVDGKIGIGTDTPSQELDVIGDISAKNLNLNGSLTIDENLTVGGNFQLGTLSINAFSSDGNLADNSNLAVPTEQAVKTYVDNEITKVNNTLDTKAALNGAVNQDFATKNLSVGGNLQVSGNLEVQGDVIARDTEHIAGNVSLGDADNDEVKITGVLRSGHSSGALRIDDALHTTGSLTVDGGSANFDTSDGKYPLIISRLGSANQAAKISVHDTLMTFHYINDEASNSIWFRLQNTDTETGRGINANDNVVMTLRGDSTGGKVGIGTTNPNAQLEVSGDIQATGKLSSQNGQVRRDFVTWSTRLRTSNPIHIKTNIPKKSNIMYRILVEGYNYGVAAAINSDVVGYTYQENTIVSAQAKDYANGVSISQYYSSDGYVVVKLTTVNTNHLGFSASAWFTNPTGAGFNISATVHHQAEDL